MNSGEEQDGSQLDGVLPKSELVGRAIPCAPLCVAATIARIETPGQITPEIPSPSPPRSGGEGRGEVVLRVQGEIITPVSSPALRSDSNVFPLASEAKAPTLRAPVAWKRKITGGILGVLGFMLSPLSWWNDAIVNLPLALLFAWLVGLLYKPAAVPHSPSFDAAVILGYWLTNVLGFVLMHKGAQQVLSKEAKKYSRRDLLKDFIVSLLYTAVIVILLKTGVLKPISAYFGK